MVKTSRATSELLDELHRLTAAELSDIIKNGIPIYCKETGDEIARDKAPASYIAAAIKFLKDNDITADPGSGRFDPLEDALNGVPDFDDYEEDGRPYN